MLAKAMGANKLIGVEMNDYRIDLAKKVGLVDEVFKPGDDALDNIVPQNKTTTSIAIVVIFNLKLFFDLINLINIPSIKLNKCK